VKQNFKTLTTLDSNVISKTIQTNEILKETINETISYVAVFTTV